MTPKKSKEKEKDTNQTKQETQVEVVLKKRRKPRSKNKKQYFTQDTEDAIVEYNNSDDMVERYKLYDGRISYPFDKLAENILNTFIDF